MNGIEQLLGALKGGGFVFDIQHVRRYRVAYRDIETGKVVTKVEMYSKAQLANWPFTRLPIELLPKGGKTVLTIFIPQIGYTVSAEAQCRNDENYNKRVGLAFAILRIQNQVERDLGYLLRMSRE